MHKKLMVALTTFVVSTLSAQEPPAKPWASSVGAGLAVTSGNTDTQTINLSFGTTYDPKTGRLFKADALYLRAEANDELQVDKAAALARYERSVSERVFWFGEVSYLRDPFKSITYLIAPLGGVGYHLIKTDARRLSVDGAVGAAVEKNTVLGTDTSAAIKAGESFDWTLSPTSKFTQRLNGLWKADDFEDALYHFDAGLTTTIAARAELKLAYVYDYKNKPPLATIEKGDSAMFAALLFTFCGGGRILGEWPVAAGVLLTVLVTLLFRWTTLDVDLQALAFEPSSASWPHAQRFPWTLLHDFGTVPGVLLALGALGAYTASFVDRRWLAWRFPALYLFVLTALGPGLVTNILGKVLAGRPRPDEIESFGGTMQFLHPFELGTPGKGFSFLCGHCSMGFLFLAFFFLIERGPLRWLALVLASLYGLLLGVARVVDGAHFPSDILLDGTLMFTLAAATAPIARIEVHPEAWRRRTRAVLAGALAGAVLIVMFLFSMPINRERIYTWMDQPHRRPATRETLLPWADPRELRIDVERGVVHMTLAAQRERVTITSLVTGYGFPGAGGKSDVIRTGDAILYTHRLTGPYWEARPSFHVTIATDARLDRIVVRTGEGEIVIDPRLRVRRLRSRASRPWPDAPHPSSPGARG